MKPKTKKQSYHSYHSPHLHPPPNLQNIIKDIKFLQTYVSQMDTNLAKHRDNQPNHPSEQSAQRKKHSSLKNTSFSQDLKRNQQSANSCNKYHNLKTMRRSPKIQHHSAVLKNYSDTV